MTKSERFEQLDELLLENDGMLQTSQVIASGIVKPIFYEYVQEKKMEQIAHGIYVSEDAWVDAMFLLHLRCSQAVFSHESLISSIVMVPIDDGVKFQLKSILEIMDEAEYPVLHCHQRSKRSK